MSKRAGRETQGGLRCGVAEKIIENLARGVGAGGSVKKGRTWWRKSVRKEWCQ